MPRLTAQGFCLQELTATLLRCNRHHRWPPVSLSLPEGRSLPSINTSEQTHASSLRPALVNFQHFSSKPSTNKLSGFTLNLSSLLPRACVCSATQSCTTPCDPLDRSLPGSSIHGISQERITEWVCHFLIQWICHPLELRIYRLCWCTFSLMPTRGYCHTSIYYSTRSIFSSMEKYCDYKKKLWLDIYQ